MRIANTKFICIFFILTSLSLGIKAQSLENIEFQIEAGGGKGTNKVTNYHFNLSSGYIVTDKISTGIGIGYLNNNNRTDLKSGIKDGRIETGNHDAWRPFLYGKYNFLPDNKISPFVSVKLGYSFFSNQKFNYVLNKGEDPFGSSELPDQNLELKGGVYTTIDVGLYRSVGQRGTKLYVSLSYDLQPLTYKYLTQNVKENISSFGANIGIIF